MCKDTESERYRMLPPPSLLLEFDRKTNGVKTKYDRKQKKRKQNAAVKQSEKRKQDLTGKQYRHTPHILTPLKLLKSTVHYSGVQARLSVIFRNTILNI